MRFRSLLAGAVITALAAVPAFSSMSGGSSEPPRSSSQNPLDPDQPVKGSSLRQDAEAAYALAYEEVSKAKKDLAADNAKSAEKHFKRALDQSQHAVERDEKYYEAWNLVGYCSRKLGDYDRAFASYGKALDIKSDYAPAREYLGEAWLEKGDPKKAREQLLFLERINATPEADNLRTQLTAWMTAHPDSSKGAPGTSPASSDSTSASRGTTGSN
jgi:tetratricopeptide (TPR) repeat protein